MHTGLEDIPIGILLAVLILLLFCSAFFSASETATMALNRYRLQDRADKKERKAIVLKNLLDQPDRLLGTILLGNNLVNNAAVAISTIIAWRLYGEYGVAASTGFITIVILVFAEIPPKTIAATHPEKIAYFASYVLEFLLKVLHPIVWFVSAATKIFNFIPGIAEKSSSDSLSADELRMAILASTGHLLTPQESMLLEILNLGSAPVDSVMVPRSKIKGLNLDDELGDLVEQIKSSPFTRLPVYKGTIDSITGELELRKLLQIYDSTEITKENIQNTAVEPIFAPEGSPILEQIQNLQSEFRHMGIVVDEYGDIKGLVTLREMLEEIAGIVWGQIPEGVTPGIRKDEESDSYLIDAKISIRDLNRVMNWALPTDGPHTLNGMILEHLEDIPQPGETMELNGFKVETVRVRGTAVVIARVKKIVEETSESESDETEDQPSP